MDVEIGIGDYQAALRLLETVPSHLVKPGLGRISAVLETLGHPERAVPVVHIVGTNGKGSVAAMLDRVLREAGYRVGLYTSPHLSDVRERIRIQGACIAEADFCRHASVLGRAIRPPAERPSYFELLTAMAFRHFSECSLDVAIMEAGMGGRWDATHQGSALCCVLTNVGLDHTEYLGSTLADIAREKAGIAAPAVPFVVGELPREAEQAARNECTSRGGRWISAAKVDVRSVDERWDGSRFEVQSATYEGSVELSLPGGWQRENLRIALAALDSLRSSGLVVQASPLVEGLRRVRWPGRFESVRGAPRIVLDGAHNPAGIAAVCDSFRRLAPHKQTRHLLFGAMNDKAVSKMLEILLPEVSGMTVTTGGGVRAMRPHEVAEIASRFGVGAKISDTVADGIAIATASLEPSDVLLVTGSLVVVGQARVELLEAGCLTI